MDLDRERVKATSVLKNYLIIQPERASAMF